MKISFERKILAGFIINLVVVIVLASIFILLYDRERDPDFDITLMWTGVLLFILSVILLATVYFIIRAQIRSINVFQNSLSQNRQLLQSILDNTSNPISIKKITGEYVLINKHFESLFNHTKEEIIGKTDQDFLPGKVAETFRNSDLEVLIALKELRFEETITQSDGDHTYIAIKFPLFDSRGKVESIGSISIDITERKKLEESLNAVSRFFNNSADIMALISNDRFIRVNPAFSRLMGYSEEELTGKPLVDFVFIGDKATTMKELINRAADHFPVKLVNRWVHKDHSMIWMEWSATYDRAAQAIYATAHDITAVKEREASLVIAEKFFAMSYEVLAVIKDNYLVKVNPAFTRILGRTQSEMYSVPYLSFVHPDDAHIIRDALDKLKAGNTMEHFRLRMQTKAGLYRNLDWTATFDSQTGELYGVVRDITKIIETEESLKTVDNFFDISIDAFFVAKERKVIKINPAFTKILGYTQADLKDLSILDLIHPDDLKIAGERLARRLKGEGIETDVTYQILCKDGSWKWIESIMNADTETGMLYAVLQDVTQKRLDDEKLYSYTQKLKEEEQQIEAIFEGAPDSVIVIDSENTILKWNKMAESVFGWKAEEAIGKPIYELIVPEKYRELHKKGMEHFIATGTGRIINKSTEVEAVNKEGKEFPVSLSISPVNIGEKQIFIGFVRDITANKEALYELYENEEKLRLIIENISEGVIVANTEREIVMANEMANEILEIEEGVAVPFNLSDRFELYLPDQKTVFPSQNLPIERALAGENTTDVDLFLLSADQKKRVLISARPLMDQDHKVVAAVVTIKDISKYKQLEEELNKTEKKYRQLIGFKS